MTGVHPVADLDTRFSSDGAQPTEWADAVATLAAAELYWLSTVRPDGRPHVTPLIAVWLDDALSFCTGPDERKARNLAANPHCVLTTGRNALGEGLDIVLEGDAVRSTDAVRLQRLAVAYETKYGSDWHFTVGEGVFHSAGGAALVFEVAPSTAFGFAKAPFAQTRWRFAPR
jgi:hypothetical protein